MWNHLISVLAVDLHMQHGWMSCQKSSTPFVIDKPLLLLRRGPSPPSLWVAFLPTWLICADQVSCISRVTPRYHAVSNHWSGALKNWTGLSLWMHLTPTSNHHRLPFTELCCSNVYPSMLSEKTAWIIEDDVLLKEEMTWTIMTDRKGHLGLINYYDDDYNGCFF